MVHKQIIIVGLGLAGSILSWHLLKRNIPFIVIDKPDRFTSSKVAAGIMNPTVFRYLTLSWKAPGVFDEAVRFYRNFELETSQNVLHDITIARILSENEPVKWRSKLFLPGFDQFLEIADAIPHLEKTIDAPYGFGLVKNVAWLDTNSFLNFIRLELNRLGALVEETFIYDTLKIQEQHILYKDIKADKIVFCEGHAVSDNPWFNRLPFRPVKGEVLTLHIPELNTNQLLNKDVFILPLGNDLYRVGSTYDWNFVNDKPTNEARTYLTDKLVRFLRVPFELVDHQSGIRPAIADRRPVTGRHPLFKPLHIFNGLGSKGAMLAPSLAQKFINQLVNELIPDDETDTSRFKF